MGTKSPDDQISAAAPAGEGHGPGASPATDEIVAKGEAEADDDERRGESRQPIELKVEYKRLNTFFSDFTKNISRGGTFIKTSRPLPIGTEFLFKLFVPVLTAPLVLRGQVQWIVSEADVVGRGRDAVPGMGIRFVELEGQVQRDLERVVEKLMVDSLGQLLYSRLMDAGKGPR